MGLLHAFLKPNVQKLKAKADIEGLIQALNYKKDLSVCEKAAEALGELGDPHGIEGLKTTLLTSHIGFIKGYCAKGLSISRDKSAMGPLMEVLRDSSMSFLVHASVLEAIGAIGPAPTTFPLIVEKLDHRDAVVRNRAWEILRETNDEGVVDPFISYLAAGKTEFRKVIINRLGSLKDLRAVDPLINLLDDAEAKLPSYKALNEILVHLSHLNRHENIKSRIESALDQHQEIANAVRQNELIKKFANQLVDIGIAPGFLATAARDGFDENLRNMATRKMGHEINELGGIELMRKVAQEVQRRLHTIRPAAGRELEVAWGFIGKWLP